MIEMSVVVPTTGPSERLDRCLRALAQQTRPPSEILIACTEGTASDRGEPADATVRLVTVRGPGLFCHVANRGIAASRAPWVLLLNDDVTPSPTFLERLIEGLPADARVGMACGKLLAGDGRTIDSTGQFVSRARTAIERGHGEPDRGQYDVPGYVFCVPGAAGLYRRQMLEELAINGQYFDERLGMYLEDLELGLRAQRAGWRAYYVPQAVGAHARGATAKRYRPRPRWLARYYLPWLAPELQARYVLNRYALMRRYASFGSLLRDAPWILWYEVRLWGYLLGLNRSTLRLILRAPGVRR